MCLLTRSIPASCGQSVPGVKAVWFARLANAGLYLYANDDFSYIDWILRPTGNPTPFYEFECDIEFVTGTEVLDRGLNGKSFPQTFVMRFAQMQKEKRETFEAMIYDQLIVVYQDMNDRYWLLGQNFGLQLSRFLATPDTNKGGNRYEIEFIGREVELMREVNPDHFIYKVPNGPAGNKIQITNLGGSGPNGGITQVLNTWGEAGIGGPWMPLAMLGNAPLRDLMQ